MSYEMAFRLIRSTYFVLHADCLPAATARLHMINIISQFYSDYQNASDATVSVGALQSCLHPYADIRL